MEEILTEQVIRSAIGTFIGIVGSAMVGLICGAFKMYWDVRELKKDMNAAFAKIREIEGRRREPRI